MSFKPCGTNVSSISDKELNKRRSNDNSTNISSKPNISTTELSILNDPEYLKQSIQLLKGEIEKTNEVIERQELKMKLAKKVKTYDKKSKY
jgi:hypothetical protein